jgi:hypothetical protein
MVRSGTTWAYDMLTSHPQVAGALETRLFNPMKGLPVFLQPDWHWNAQIGDAPTGGLQELMSREEVVADLREIGARWLARAVEPQHRFLVEKTPAHVYAIRAIAEIYPEARFVHVLRDGRDVAVSTLAAGRSFAPAWREHYATRFADAGREWQARVRVARADGGRLGRRFTEVRYEQMKADPRGACRTLFGFCGIPFDDEIVERAVAVTDFDRNFRGGEGSFRRRGAVGEWRQRFGALDAARFDRAAGAMLVETGYEKGRWWWLSRARGRSRP